MGGRSRCEELQRDVHERSSHRENSRQSPFPLGRRTMAEWLPGALVEWSGHAAGLRNARKAVISVSGPRDVWHFFTPSPHGVQAAFTSVHSILHGRSDRCCAATSV